MYHIDFLNMEHNRQIFLSFWMSFFFPFRKYGAGAGLLKQGGDGGRVALFLFNYFKDYNFSFLHLEIALPFAKLCYAFERKL